MRHRRKMFKLARTTEHSWAILTNLACSLIEHHRIRTTVAKAKALRPFIEKLITKARRGTLHDRRIVASKLGNNSIRVEKVVRKLFAEIAPLNVGRPGGYTRIYKLGPRVGDAAPMAFIEFVEQPVKAQAIPEPTPAAKKAGKADKDEAKKAPAKKAPAKKAKAADEEPAAEAPAAETAAEEKKPARKPRAKKAEKTEDESAEGEK